MLIELFGGFGVQWPSALQAKPIPRGRCVFVIFFGCKVTTFFYTTNFFHSKLSGGAIFFRGGGFFFLRSSIKYGCFLAYRLNVVVFSVPHCVTIESPPDILHYETLICKDIVGSTLHSLGGAVEIQPLRGGKIIRHI